MENKKQMKQYYPGCMEYNRKMKMDSPVYMDITDK
jgi:hypothetical protein